MTSPLRRLAVPVVRGAVMAALWPLERALVGSEEGPPPCFVVGPPRSGTTLLYELMVHRFRFAYISNLAHRFYLTPVAATRVGRSSVLSWQGDFESRFGHIEGWGAPNEGGWVWNRWIPQAHHLGAEHAEPIDGASMRAMVQGIGRVLGGPFLNKNVMHSVHMPVLDRVFPGCTFVELRREPVANVRSILRAREKGGGSAPDGWWSVKPRGCEGLESADAVTQACAQVLGVRADVERDARLVGSDRRLIVEYEDLCADPRGQLDRIGAFLASHGAPVEARRDAPAAFEHRVGKPMDPETESRIAAQLEPPRGVREGVAAS